MHGLFIDNFCGGGGASTGIAAAIGRDVDVAINHDPFAIAVHRANHPTTKHHCQDIRAVWPAAVTGLQDVAGAWFSPDCKEFSKAKGGPVKNRHIRALAGEIEHWLRDTRPVVAYIENVEEFEKAAPLDDDGVPIKGQEGALFRGYVRSWRRLGYKVEWKLLRACDYGAPTSRRRLYIIMRRDGLPIVWPKPTHGPAGNAAVRKGKLRPYRTAAECIDWTIDCPSIFLTRDEVRERKMRIKRPLEEATLRRVAHGVMRFVVDAAQPFIVPITHTQNAPRAHAALDPLRTITTANGGEFMAADVTLAPHVTKFHSGSVGSDMASPMPTVSANGEPARPAGAVPLGMVAATMAPLQNGERRPGEQPRAQELGEPTSTIATGGKFAVITAHMEKFNADSRPAAVSDPLGTAMASSAQHALIGCSLVQSGHGERDGQAPRALDPGKPLGVVAATAENFAAVEAELQAVCLDRQFGASSGAAVDQPTPATTAGGGGKTAQVSALLSRFHRSNTNGGSGQVPAPLGAVTAGGQHHALVCAHMEQANTGGMLGRAVTRPATTLTTTGAQQRLVQTTILPEDALSPDLMKRANLVAAFLVKYYGTGAIGQKLGDPMHTVPTLDRFAVVTVTIDAVTYVIVDIGLRMLTPRELARAQGFPEGYILDPIAPQMIRGHIVHKPLTKAAQIRMIGNSVCPDVARELVGANQPGVVPSWSGTVSEMKLAA